MGLLLATWATSKGGIKYEDTVHRASSLIGLSKIRHVDREAFSSQLRQLERSGVVGLIRPNQHVKWIQSVRCYSSRDMWRRALDELVDEWGDVPSRNDVLSLLRWKELSRRAKAEFLRTFAVEAYRVVLTEASFFCGHGLSNREVANALGNYVPPSIAKALNLTSVKNRLLLARLADGVVTVAKANGAKITGLLVFVSVALPPRFPKGPRREHEKTVARFAEKLARRLSRGKATALAKLLGFPMFLWAYLSRSEGATLPELWENKSPVDPLERRRFRRMTREIERAGL